MKFLKIKTVAKQTLHAANNLLWPTVCINCRTQIAQHQDQFCRECWEQLTASNTGSYCHRCGRDTTEYGMINDACPACQQQQSNFHQIARAGTYSGTLKSMVLAFKNSHCQLAPILADLAKTALNTAPFQNSIDYFVPVPLHWKRRFSRGYNQSLLIAKILTTEKSKINTDLVRIRNTPAQPSMSTPAARARNVADAFAVRKGHKFEGKNICLVDDVKTTGATLSECAKVLNQAGAEKVYALVLAVAGQNTN
jgi:competence protein ComFC